MEMRGCHTNQPPGLARLGVIYWVLFIDFLNHGVGYFRQALGLLELRALFRCHGSSPRFELPPWAVSYL